MINLTQHHFTRIAGSAALGAMTFTGAAFAQSGSYLPSDGLVVVEMESLTDGAGWSGSTTVDGFAGEGYVAWSGPDMSKTPGEGLVGFDTDIATGGKYELRLRNRHDHPDVTDANDVWVRVDGGEWTKVFSSQRGEWTWDTRCRTADGKVGPVSIELTPGSHKVEFSGRSEGFMIDRVHLFKEGTSNALSITRAPSKRVVLEDAPEVETPKGEESAKNAALDDGPPPFSEGPDFDLAADAATKKPEAKSPQAGTEGSPEASKTLPTNARQPGPFLLPSMDAAFADKVNAQLKGAKSTRGASASGPRVKINDALDTYGSSASRRGLSRFDIALGLEGTSEGAGTAFSQGPFIAKNYANNTVDQNKGLRIRALRMNRAPRDTTERINDIIHWPGGDHCIENVLAVVPQGFLQWAHNVHRGPNPLQMLQRSLTWDNVSVRPDPSSGAPQLKWGTREYNVPDRRFINCDFTEIPQEHGLYVSNAADTTIDGCTFLRIGSQGAQFAHRDQPYQQYDADNMSYLESPTHIVRDSHFIDCAYGGTRPSFNLTYFSPGSSAHPGSVLIEDCSFVCDWPTTRADGHSSTGALVICKMGGTAPLNPAVGQMMSSVTIRNSLFDFTDGDRSIASIRSVDDLIIEESCFIARDHDQPHLHIDRDYTGNDLGGTKTQRITVRDNIAVGVDIMLRLNSSTSSQARVTLDLHCPGEEIVYDGTTGEEISRRAL
ncbi:MAG: hypothetical protein P8M11_15245 [Planctomycetota bacterium]|nr:hypothetical protein [Planctomycetota bacterium]MDG1985910.1 hypothetical protein [Planctomycetota bacterium]